MWVPPLAGGTRRTTVLVRAHENPSRVGCVVNGVPLLSYQVVPGTFPPKGGAPQGMKELDLLRAGLEAAALPVS